MSLVFVFSIKEKKNVTVITLTAKFCITEYFVTLSD